MLCDRHSFYEKQIGSHVLFSNDDVADDPEQH